METVSDSLRFNSDDNTIVEYAQSCLVCGATIQTADYPIRDFGICNECKETILMSRCLVDKLKEGKFD